MGAAPERHDGLLPDVPPAKLGKPIAFAPSADGSPGAAVVWLHGFGDQPDGWAQLLRPLRRAAPGVRWLHLRAPPLAQPCYQGRKLPGWGQFFSTECLHVGSRDHDDPDVGGSYAASARAVHGEIARLQREHGVAPERVIVAGFSQGAALALESALCFGGRLAGCIALSGWLTPRARAAAAAGAQCSPPVLLCHGARDDMVGHDCGEAAAEALRVRGGGDAAGVRTHFHSFPRLEHSSCREELRLVANFVHTALRPGGPAGDPAELAELPVPEWAPGGTGARSDSEGSDSGGEEDSGSSQEVLYVGQAALEALRERLRAGGDISDAAVLALVDLDDLPDDAPLAPVGAGGLGADCGDVDEAIRLLGAKAAAERLVAAADAEEARQATPLTAGDLRTLLEGDEEGAEEEEEEEEEASDEAEEDSKVEDAAAEDAAAKQEPASGVKRQRTQ